ncbi:uncharacterized protein LOC124361550 [Homalodisca vitripennis]|uniref:uncharacterized protein LOC124361550 n=1 Tax=Homalodisca vitripennis TaxID=197043 RepID=UPI001EEA28CD|nr:uncharacterized protein LOC124361550 [Homalodisca vitripennis]
MNAENQTVKRRGCPRIHHKRLHYQNVGRGVPLRTQARKLVCTAKEYFQQEKTNNGPLLPVAKVVQRTAAALGINKNTVVNICSEKKKNIVEGGSGQVHTPNKKKLPRQKRVTNLDNFQKDAIRRHVYAYYRRKEYPTLKKLIQSLKDADLFNGCKSSLSLVLKQLGFKYKSVGKRKVLLERPDVVAWRCRFLRQMKNLNLDEVVWIDETWVNTNHSQTNAWTDDSVQGTMSVPLGKGGRMILLHAGNSKGFIPNSLLLFSSKKTSDYHEEMDHEKFLGWFVSNLLPNLEESSTIVFDNAKYHSKVLDKAPTMASKKCLMVEWLQKFNIPFEADMKKAELLEVIHLHKPRFLKYVIDELAKERGHTVIRLPPYHCHFNAIELIWAQIKGHVAKNNKTFSLTEVTRLTKEGIDLVTGDEWKNILSHTRKTIEDAWKNEGVLETGIEELIITLNSDDDSSDDSSAFSDD